MDWAVDFRGVERGTNTQLQLTQDSMRAEETALDSCYIYGGRVHSHYGHFIINTLPRLWPLAVGRQPDLKILCHDSATPESWFTVPFIATILKALGLTPDNFVVFTRPTRLRRVIVPQTSLGEQTHGYYCFRALCHRISMMIGGGNERVERTPVYLSKTKLAGGVGRIRNEFELEAALHKSGVEILYPELLTISEQIALFAQPRVIMGTTGSAFHSSIFSPPRSKIICLNQIHNVNSNFAIIDRLNGNTSEYYYQKNTTVTNDSASGFLTEFVLPDPNAAASDLLHLADQL